MICSAKTKDAQAIALLHRQTINQGFLAKLGIPFLQSLYKFLIRKELVLAYCENNNTLGFVSCALSSKGIMKRFLRSSPVGIFQLLFALFKKPSLITPLWETFRAPSLSNASTDEHIPETELLSICVSPQAQQGGIGGKLVNELEKELKNRKITRYKVIAGAKLNGANRFYIKNGFQLSKQITIHGKDLSNVYIKEIVS